MRALLFSRSLPIALAARAAASWALLRTLITAVFLLVPPTEATATRVAEPSSPNPIAVILLCVIVGIVDLRRRREIMLWGNLGVSLAQLTLFFAVIATIGELFIALVLR
ncbi:MAG: hypothetical protein JWL95_1787 [Gemmatimonadetes bacterium]|nr:hypothetical protein [Gemmatimonadota bacterium]